MGIPISHSQTPKVLCHYRQLKAAAQVPPPAQHVSKHAVCDLISEAF